MKNDPFLHQSAGEPRAKETGLKIKSETEEQFRVVLAPTPQAGKRKGNHQTSLDSPKSD